MDKESSRGIGMRLLAQRLNNRNLIFFGSPEPALASAKAAAGKPALEEHCSETLLRSSPFLQTPADYKLLHIHTHTDVYKDMHSPPHPDPSPPSLWTASLTSGSVTSAGNGCRTGWLLAGAGLLPLLQSHVYGVCVCCWGVFPVLTLYSKRSIVRGLFFSPHLPHVMLYFSSIPCLPVLSIPLSYMYVVYVWTGWWLISQVLVTSDNKGYYYYYY